MVTTNTEPAADREIVFDRTFSATRDLVWQAWTTPEHVAQWWGPNGFTNTIHEMDVKPGGVWRFIMHGPDGTDYPNKVVFSEVVKPSRLVYAHGGDDKGLAHFHVTVTFDEQDGRTALTMRMLFPSKTARDMTVEKYGAVDGGNQTLARLERHLETM
ncbi:MAG: SRPBCC family protein [Planctomycetaceae bacterium]